MGGTAHRATAPPGEHAPAAGGALEQAGPRVLAALGAQPGGPELLAASAAREDVALVGGAVRDLLLARAPRELDVVVDADAPALARQLADALRAQTVTHERFGTAAVEWAGGRIDIAQRRAESYPAPGALPEVRPGGPQEDLRRRDFTLNAIAVTLAGPRRAELQAAEHALEDLAAGRLRVLHDRSFTEDPTRLLRLARYRARLRLRLEPHTARLAADALAAGALATVSRSRIGAELRLALAEADPAASIEAFDELGLLGALDSRLRFDGQLARRALELLRATGHPRARADLLVLSTLLAPLASEHRDEGEGQDLHTLLNELEFTAADRDIAIHDAVCLEPLTEELAVAENPSQIHEAAHGSSPQGVALAGACGDLLTHGTGQAEVAAREWLSELHDVRLQITGEDLLAAGVPEGPEIRLRLHAALTRKLDGDLDGDGPAAELAAALEAPV
jgi:tRNA nucleotidyltransferase (CCA-adding enzyme)